jgi:hypothetical protein
MKRFSPFFLAVLAARTYCRPEFMVADCGHETG